MCIYALIILHRRKARTTVESFITFRCKQGRYLVSTTRFIFYNNTQFKTFQAISQLAWPEPTLIQETAIPLLLEGKDLLMRARTGSGKTAAFTIPVIQKILNLKNTTTCQSIKALILSPSKELCGQVKYLCMHHGKATNL